MSDIPDFMRGFDLDDDWGFETVSEKPSSEPAIDPSKIDSTTVEVAKVKQSVDDIKARMGDIMQIVAENKVKAEEELDATIEERFKNIEKINKFYKIICVLYFDRFKLAVCHKDWIFCQLHIHFYWISTRLSSFFLILAKFTSIDYIILICDLMQGLTK